MKRQFTLRELASIFPDPLDDAREYEQVDSAHRRIYFEHEGRTWRIVAKTNTDGEDELQQSLEVAAQYPDSCWEADEVKAEQVLVTRYVVVP